MLFYKGVKLSYTGTERLDYILVKIQQDQWYEHGKRFVFYPLPDTTLSGDSCMAGFSTLLLSVVCFLGKKKKEKYEHFVWFSDIW